MSDADILEHFGVKGMKWGVIRTRRQIDEDSADTVAKKEVQQKIKRNLGSTGSLSNAELQKYVTRLELEQKYSRLSSSKKNEGRKFAEEILRNEAKKYVAKGVATAVNAAFEQYKKS